MLSMQCFAVSPGESAENITEVMLEVLPERILCKATLKGNEAEPDDQTCT